MRYRNEGDETVVFRDDSGKRWIAPGEEFELVGDQHAPVIEGLEGVERVTAWRPEEEAPPAPVATPASRSRQRADQGGKEPAEDPSATSDGEAGSRPEVAAKA